MKNKIYFASPWFNKTQAEREERVKKKLRELGFDVWSPKDNNSLSPITDPKIRKAIFEANVKHMCDCEIIFAITDEKDMGTIWEAGFCCGIRNNSNFKSSPIIVYYCETLGEGMFNLMLAQSGDIVITKFEDIDRLPQLIMRGDKMAYAGCVE